MRRAVVLSLLAGLALGGCRRGERAAVYIDKLVVTESAISDRLPPSGLKADDIRKAALLAIAREKSFAAGAREVPEDARAFHARVTLVFARELEDRTGTGRVTGGEQVVARPLAEVGVEVELEPAGPGGVLREATLGREQMAGRDPEGRRIAYAVAVEKAVSSAVDGLALQLAAEQKSDDALIQDLHASDPRKRDYAVRVLSDRRNPAAVPALIERLGETDRGVVERTVGALAVLKDRRAVPALIELTRGKEPGFVAQVTRVIGDIGGKDAEAYLMTLESGHPDPGVREAAQESLAELHGRGDKGAQAMRR